MENTTTFGNQKLIVISRFLAFLFSLIFVVCIVATGLIVYNFTNCHREISEIEDSVNGNNQYAQDEETTVGSEEITDEFTTEFTTTESIENKEDIENVRLPRHITPKSYNIKLIPFIIENNFTFLGQIQIIVVTTEKSKNITLHADDLIIKKISVSEFLTKAQLSIEKITNETKNNFLIIHLNKYLNANYEYEINITYEGILNDLLQGFYRSSYKSNNTTKWLAATQFQATDARKAFPCLDEPALKARFQINLARFKNMSAISNMPKIGESKLDDDFVWDHFEESVPMSTYLVAFVISDFECIKSGNFSVCVRSTALSQTKYAIEIGPKILKFYEEFFKIKYPLPKLDMIGLPDFSAGAMENWGLITYRESVLLYEEKVSSKNSLQRIAHVIAHELAHQWFGNLVTPLWWSDLWLNEGFATYMESLGANSVNPNIKELDQFLLDELHPALMLDGLQTSHPISIKVNNPDEINDIFDRISYSKGASIIRMMQHFLTMEVFRKGLNSYLLSRIYKNAEQDDLWHTLTEQSHLDGVLDKNVTLKEIMDSWTLQTGYPIITAQRAYSNNTVTFTQTKFHINKVDKSKKSVTWWVPLTFYGPQKILNSAWLKAEPIISVYLNISHNDWFLVNVNQTGFYRVNYDKKNWVLITEQLLKKNGHLIFDPKNRAQILDDSANLADAGYLNYEVALNITKYLKQEREFLAWKTALVNLDYLYGMFIRTAHFDKFKTYLINLMNDFYNEMGFIEHENDAQLLIYSRAEITSRMCKLGVRDCVVHSVGEFQTWKNSPNPDKRNLISENMRGIVYCTAIGVGGQEEWDFAWQRYLNANVENEKEILLIALGCSKEIWILSRYLEWAVTENSGIRKHDSSRVFAAVANNPIGQELVYRFLKTHFKKLRSYLGSSAMLSSVVRSCTMKLNTQAEIDDFKTFLRTRSKEFGTALRTAQQSIERGEINVKWMDRNSETIIKWLTNSNK